MWETSVTLSVTLYPKDGECLECANGPVSYLDPIPTSPVPATSAILQIKLATPFHGCLEASQFRPLGWSPAGQVQRCCQIGVPGCWRRGEANKCPCNVRTQVQG